MNSSISSVINILVEADAGGEPLLALLEQVAQVVEEHAVQQNITDWPFEHFWSDPSEPRHSKLLRYFINPSEKHGCGPFLLREFVETLVKALPLNHEFPAISQRQDEFWRACGVDAEIRRGDDEPGQLDLLITRAVDRERFAIIVENKIKGAPNQPKQLQNYVTKAKNRSANFREKEIFVFFLPLIDDRFPDKEDVAAIQKQGVEYSYVTFENQILPWLNAVLETNWPDGSSPEIREHLSYYRNFIEYLVNQRKKSTMSSQILERLKQAADDSKSTNRALPSWNEVQRLETSLSEMKPHFQRMLRGNLLLRIESLLKEKQLIPEWYLADNGIATPLRINAEFNESFDQGASLSVFLSDEVKMVRVTVSTSSIKEGMPTFFVGCLLVRPDEESNGIQSQILEIASEWFKTTRDKNTFLPWIKYGPLREEITYSNCQEEVSAEKVVEELLEFRDYLASKLRPSE